MQVKAVTLDKIVACGSYSQRYKLESYLDNTLFLKHRFNAKYPYREFYSMLDGSNIQVAEIEVQRKGSLKPLRVEFNPNNKMYTVEHQKMIRVLENPHFTRLDVAFDFEIDMSNWKWIDLQARPQRHYYGRNGKLETVYVGGKDSNIIYRIYDKAAEQKIKNKVWWRVEVQFRREAAQIFYETIDSDMNIFSDVFPVAHYFNGDMIAWDSLLQSELNIKDKAMIHYLIDFPEGFSELSVNTRSKYKRLMKNVCSFMGAELRNVYKKEKPAIAADLKHWYDLTCV